MFSKLFKYEVKSISRIFLVAWPALIILALFNGFIMGNINAHPYSATGNPILYGISSIAFIAVFVTIIVLNIIVVVMRFHRGLLKDEGYLMFSLPVTIRQIVLSKATVALVLSIVNSIVAAIAILIMLSASMSFSEIAGIFQYAFEEIRLLIGNVGLVSAEIILLYIIGLAASIYQAYASLSIGHLAPKHKVAAAVGAYVGISIIISLITEVAGSIMGELGIYAGNISNELIYGPSTFSNTDLQLSIVISMIGLLIQIAVLHIVTEQILSKKLNLE